MSTNISDTDEYGRTTTTLVDTHDRGSRDFNRRRGEPDAKAARKASKAKAEPDERTVDEVIADVDAGKLSAQKALDAERAGKNRSTLIAQLESRGGQ